MAQLKFDKTSGVLSIDEEKWITRVNLWANVEDKAGADIELFAFVREAPTPTRWDTLLLTRSCKLTMPLELYARLERGDTVETDPLKFRDGHAVLEA